MRISVQNLTCYTIRRNLVSLFNSLHLSDTAIPLHLKSSPLSMVCLGQTWEICLHIVALETSLTNASLRNYCFIRLTTDNGLTGVGEAHLEWQERPTQT